MKTCGQCRERKALDEFYKHSKPADGRMSICKVCHKANVTRRRRENPDVQAYDRARAKTPKRRAAARTITIKWRKAHPEKYRAQTAVGNAIRDGKLKKGDRCEAEGCERTDVHAHHDDYSKPLDVRWLCPLHHHRHHADVAA